MQDAFIWAHQSHFSAEMLASLRNLNLRFLDLLVAHAGEPRLGGIARPTAAVGMPLASAERLAPLSALQRAAAADCPYALFDLNLCDESHWLARRSTLPDSCIADALPVPEDTACFLRLVFFYAWHVAATPRCSARLWLGMSEGTADVFRDLPLNSLPQLAASESSQLSARWRASTFFWSSLATSAGRGDARRLRKVHLFGLQLAAAALLP